MKMIRILVVLMIALSGCSNTPFKGNEVVGADEFVIDSYKIKEGKLSILEMEGRPLEVLDPELLEEYTNTVDNGDVLKIALFHASRGDLSGAVQTISETIGYTVTDGEITLPDIPPIEVKGLKLSEARDRIQKAYDREIDGIEVFIAYQKRNVKKIELAGMVSQSSIPVNGKKRLFEVLAEAKVPTNANLFKSYLVRDGKPLPIDMHRLIKEGDMSQNVVMRGGDKIYVANAMASNVMVMGEVGIAKVIPVPTGSISLREALAAAGGIPFTGNRNCIQVIRGSVLNPKIYRLSWNHVAFLPNDSLLLMPGDTVFISETPITKWNRFINQLLPSSMLLDFGVRCKGVCGW